MRLLLDTQLLVWIPLNDRRISRPVREAVLSPDTSLHVSAAVAFEFTDLQLRKRFPVHEPIDVLAEQIGFSIENFPADGWRIAKTFPTVHRDPVDRMLIAHAILGGFTLATADADIHRFPVKTL